MDVRRSRCSACFLGAQDKNKKEISRKPAWMLDVIPRNAETVSAFRGNHVFMALKVTDNKSAIRRKKYPLISGFI